MTKKIILSILAIIVAFSNFVYATEAELTNDDVMLISSDVETINSDDFQAGDIVSVQNKSVNGNAFIAGEKVTVSNYTVAGDLFVAAQSIDLKGVNVGGSVFVAGEYITFSESTFSGNLYVAGSVISIERTVVQDVFSASANLKIDETSSIVRSLNATADNMTINNAQIGRNANLSVTSLNVGPDAKIAGGLFYSSTNEANIAETASIGNVNFNEIVASESTTTFDLSTIAYNIVVVMLKTIFVGGFIFLFAQGFIEKQKVKNIAVHLGKNAAKGLLWTIVIPVVSIVLLCTGVTIGLSFSLLAIYFIIFNISSALVAVSISTALTQKMQYNAWRFYGITILISILIGVLGQIPTLGAIVTIFVGLAGMGLIFSGLKNIKVKEEQEPEIVS